MEDNKGDIFYNHRLKMTAFGAWRCWIDDQLAISSDLNLRGSDHYQTTLCKRYLSRSSRRVSLGYVYRRNIKKSVAVCELLSMKKGFTALIAYVSLHSDPVHQREAHYHVHKSYFDKKLVQINTKYYFKQLRDRTLRRLKRSYSLCQKNRKLIEVAIQALKDCCLSAMTRRSSTKRVISYHRRCMLKRVLRTLQRNCSRLGRSVSLKLVAEQLYRRSAQIRCFKAWYSVLNQRKQSSVDKQRIVRARSLTLASTFYKRVMYQIIHRAREVRVFRFCESVHNKRALTSAMTKLLKSVSRRVALSAVEYRVRSHLYIVWRFRRLSDAIALWTCYLLRLQLARRRIKSISAVHHRYRLLSGGFKQLSTCLPVLRVSRCVMVKAALHFERSRSKEALTIFRLLLERRAQRRQHLVMSCYFWKCYREEKGFRHLLAVCRNRRAKRQLRVNAQRRADLMLRLPRIRWEYLVRKVVTRWRCVVLWRRNQKYHEMLVTSQQLARRTERACTLASGLSGGLLDGRGSRVSVGSDVRVASKPLTFVSEAKRHVPVTGPQDLSRCKPRVHSDLLTGPLLPLQPLTAPSHSGDGSTLLVENRDVVEGVDWQLLLQAKPRHSFASGSGSVPDCRYPSSVQSFYSVGATRQPHLVSRDQVKQEIVELMHMLQLA